MLVGTSTSRERCSTPGAGWGAGHLIVLSAGSNNGLRSLIVAIATGIDPLSCRVCCHNGTPTTATIAASAAAPAMPVHCQRPNERHQLPEGEAFGGGLALRTRAVRSCGTGGPCWAASSRGGPGTRPGAGGVLFAHSAGPP